MRTSLAFLLTVLATVFGSACSPPTRGDTGEGGGGTDGGTAMEDGGTAGGTCGPCNAPPPSVCADLTTVRESVAPGSCGAATETCSYTTRTVTCPTGRQCSQGTCVTPPPSCSSANCSGCCNATTCVAVASQGSSACGEGGAVCAPCGSTAPVCRSGACTSLCAGVSCTQPPASVCASLTTARESVSPGSCESATGTCSYTTRTVICPTGQQCSQGTCVTPPPSCSSANCSGCCNGTTCVAVASQGSSACGQGGAVCAPCGSTAPVCQSGACTSLCAGVSCIQPPASVCANQTTVRESVSPGSCASATGTCSYTTRTVTCPTGQKCSQGACVAPAPCSSANCSGCCNGTTCVAGTSQSASACGQGGAACAPCGGTTPVCKSGACTDRCAGVSCTTPMSPWCPSATTVGDYVIPGSCAPATGTCSYTTRTVICPTGQQCSSGKCVTPPCSSANCSGCCNGPTMCVPLTTEYGALCGLRGATCQGCPSSYPMCQAGKCVNGCDPTSSIPGWPPTPHCSNPPASACADSLSLTYYSTPATSCDPATGVCTYPVRTVSCPGQMDCARGSCVDWHNPYHDYSSNPTKRSSHAMAFDSSRHAVVLFGGYSSLYGALDDTWIRTSAGWQQRFPSTHPLKTSGAAMADDASRQRVVLLGSERSVWEWDGTTWTAIPYNLGPDPSLDKRMRMIYDSARRRVVAFSGPSSRSAGAGSKLDQTWEWDGLTWASRTSLNPPPMRYSYSVVYDSQRQRVLLFGGDDTAMKRLNDTWEWDGVSASWVERTPTTKPSARSRFAMSYDPDRQRVVLYGGWINGNTQFPEGSDTWEWDGANWLHRFPPTQIGNLSDAVMVWDSALGRSVLFGGNFTWYNPPPANPNTGISDYDGTAEFGP